MTSFMKGKTKTMIPFRINVVIENMTLKITQRKAMHNRFDLVVGSLCKPM